MSKKQKKKLQKKLLDDTYPVLEHSNINQEVNVKNNLKEKEKEKEK